MSCRVTKGKWVSVCMCVIESERLCVRVREFEREREWEWVSACDAHHNLSLANFFWQRKILMKASKSGPTNFRIAQKRIKAKFLMRLKIRLAGFKSWVDFINQKPDLKPSFDGKIFEKIKKTRKIEREEKVRKFLLKNVGKLLWTVSQSAFQVQNSGDRGLGLFWDCVSFLEKK